MRAAAAGAVGLVIAGLLLGKKAGLVAALIGAGTRLLQRPPASCASDSTKTPPLTPDALPEETESVIGHGNAGGTKSATTPGCPPAELAPEPAAQAPALVIPTMLPEVERLDPVVVNPPEGSVLHGSSNFPANELFPEIADHLNEDPAPPTASEKAEAAIGNEDKNLVDPYAPVPSILPEHPPPQSPFRERRTPSIHSEPKPMLDLDEVLGGGGNPLPPAPAPPLGRAEGLGMVESGTVAAQPVLLPSGGAALTTANGLELLAADVPTGTIAPPPIGNLSPAAPQLLSFAPSAPNPETGAASARMHDPELAAILPEMERALDRALSGESCPNGSAASARKFDFEEIFKELAPVIEDSPSALPSDSGEFHFRQPQGQAIPITPSTAAQPEPQPTDDLSTLSPEEIWQFAAAQSAAVSVTGPASPQVVLGEQHQETATPLSAENSVSATELPVIRVVSPGVQPALESAAAKVASALSSASVEADSFQIHEVEQPRLDIAPAPVFRTETNATPSRIWPKLMALLLLGVGAGLCWYYSESILDWWQGRLPQKRASSRLHLESLPASPPTSAPVRPPPVAAGPAAPSSLPVPSTVEPAAPPSPKPKPPLPQEKSPVDVVKKAPADGTAKASTSPPDPFPNTDLTKEHLQRTTLDASPPLPSLGDAAPVAPLVASVKPTMEVRAALELPELPVEADAPPDASPAGAEGVEQQKAREAVQHLLEANSVDRILTLVHNPKTLAPAIQAYYSGQKPQQVPFDGIVFDSGARIPATNGRAYLFRVRSPDREQGFPVSTEETPDGYKIDWEAFVQCKDRAMARFWPNPQAAAQTFYVVLQRAHYFESDVPEIDRFECLKATSPNPDDDPFFAFVPKESELGRMVTQKIYWDKKYFAVAAFSHVPHAGGGQHVELTRVLRWVWRREAE